MRDHYRAFFFLSHTTACKEETKVGLAFPIAAFCYSLLGALRVVQALTGKIITEMATPAAFLAALCTVSHNCPAV